MSVRGRRGDDASDNNHVGAVVPEEREEHGYRSVRRAENDRRVFGIIIYTAYTIKYMI